MMDSQNLAARIFLKPVLLKKLPLLMFKLCWGAGGCLAESKVFSVVLKTKSRRLMVVLTQYPLR